MTNHRINHTLYLTLTYYAAERQSHENSHERTIVLQGSKGQQVSSDNNTVDLGLMRSGARNYYKVTQNSTRLQRQS